MKNKILFLFILLPALIRCHQSIQTPANSIIVGLSDPPITLDPRFGTDANSMRISDLIFSSLVYIGNDLKPIPQAALSWKIGPKEITFTLRDDLRFHNGRKVTLEDIRQSFVEYKKPTSPFATNLEFVDTIRIDPPNKIIFEMKKYDASFLTNLFQLKILPFEEVHKTDFASHPIGSGPFSLQAGDNDKIILNRFKPSPDSNQDSNIDTIYFKFVRDENTRYLKMLKGDLDVLINELEEEKVTEIKKTGKVNVLLTPGLNFNFVLFNLKDPRLSDLQVRQALNAALDRGPIIQYKLEGLATLADSLLSPANPFSISSSENSPPENLPKNTQLNLKGITFSLKTSEQVLGNGQIIAEQLKTKLGLKINHETFEWATYYSDIKAGRFQIAVMRWVGIVDPDVYRETLSSGEFPPGHNRGYYQNLEFDKIVEMARHEQDDVKRKNLYTKAQKIVAHDLPILPLWYNANISILSRRIRNFEPATTGSFLPLLHVTKE